jgi:alkylation response protein AidB-like acyl-CoA dehydrogenase
MRESRAPETDEQRALLAEVDRFVERVVAPRVARHELTLDAAGLDAILAEAEALGLAGSDAAPSGLAPWEALESGAAVGATLSVLARVARASAAVALALHRRALARVVARRAGLALPPGPTSIALEGALGLGRTSLARLLRGAPLDDDDRAILADVYAPDAERVLALEPGMAALLTPVFADGVLGLSLAGRSALTIEAEPHAHGLDELSTARVRGASGARARCPPEELAEALGAQMLGLVAIALGAAERAYAIARRFAATRRQGGRPIDGHPAVLALLGQASRALDAVRTELGARGAGPITASQLGRIAAFRGDAGARLTDATHASLQVAGGLGYMREMGLEKAARDVNALRVMAGAPPELALFAAEWERLDG